MVIAKIKTNQEINVIMNNLNSEWLSLDELLNMEVVVASKSADKLSDAPGIVSVMTSDEISRFGGMTLAEILNRMAGLSISTSYFSDRTMISVRGDQIKANSGHVLYLINGRPVREILEGGLITELLESFPVSAIDKIEVIKGPGSVLYGTNAFSGVVNIITKTSESTDVSISPHGGWDGNYGMDGNAHLNFGNVKVSVAGKYYKKNDWDVL